MSKEIPSNQNSYALLIKRWMELLEFYLDIHSDEKYKSFCQAARVVQTYFNLTQKQYIGIVDPSVIKTNQLNFDAKINKILS